MDDTLLLIDGLSLLYRAYYALPPLTSPANEPVGAVYGFTTMLLKAISQYNPTRLAVAFDTHAPTFRHTSYVDYKATRKPMPQELLAQLPTLKKMLAAMNIKTVERAGYEADDIIGTLANRGYNTVIVTGDRDAFQLIDDKTLVAYTKKGISLIELYDKQQLFNLYGFAPQQIPDFKALFGDTSDNIPGVTGIGEKTAMSLIAEFGSLDNIYNNLNQIKAADKLLAGRENAYLSLALARIDCNVPLELNDDELKFSYPFDHKVKDVFKELGFNSLLKKESIFLPDSLEHSSTDSLTKNMQKRNIPANPDITDNTKITDKTGIFSGDNSGNMPNEGLARINKQSVKTTLPAVTVIDSINALKNIRVFTSHSVAFDIGNNTGGSIGVFDGENLYQIRLKHDLLSLGVNLEDALNTLIPLFAATEIILFDAKAVKKFLHGFNLDVDRYFDLKLAMYVADMDAMPQTESDFCDACGYSDDMLSVALFYAADEYKTAIKKAGMNELYYNIELPLVDVLFRMEIAGFKIDLNLLKTMGKDFTQKTTALAEDVFAACNKRFNLNSPKQLAAVLFNELKIPYPKRTKNYSTAVEILEPLRQSYPVIDKILDYRTLTKLNGTYIEGLKKLAGTSGVVHTEFRQTLTSTGRLSSIEPNLQNIPVRTEEGRALRALFTTNEGRSLVTADYSQIELRLLAHLSGDPSMHQAFLSGSDFHTQTAAFMYGVPPSGVDEHMRRSAKAINFGVIYGMSDYGLSQTLHVSVARAKEYIKSYFEKFPLVRKYLDGSVSFAYKNGYVQTIMGRVRKIPQINSHMHALRGFGERAAMNMPLQGSAADIIKIAMIRVDKALFGMKSRLILQVHDELIVDASDDEVDKVKQILIECMEGAVKLSVPLTVSVSCGKRWIDC